MVSGEQRCLGKQFTRVRFPPGFWRKNITILLCIIDFICIVYELKREMKPSPIQMLKYMFWSLLITFVFYNIGSWWLTCCCSSPSKGWAMNSEELQKDCAPSGTCSRHRWAANGTWNPEIKIDEINDTF
jgi:hypothetical protein